MAKSVRNLAVEEHDRVPKQGGQRGLASSIRLNGKWLQQWGFNPGSRVELRMVEPGVVEMRAVAGV